MKQSILIAVLILVWGASHGAEFPESITDKEWYEQGQALTTIAITIDESTHLNLTKSPICTGGALMPLLYMNGVTFPLGSFVRYIPELRLVIARNTEPHLELVSAWFERGENRNWNPEITPEDIKDPFISPELFALLKAIIEPNKATKK